MLFCAILKFFLEDLSYRFLTRSVSKRDFVLNFGVGCRGFLRARARVLPIRAPDQQLCRNSARGCPRSTIPVVREHDLALPDRSCPRSTIQVVRGARGRLSGEHGAGCPGARFRFFLEDLSYRFLILYVSEREFVIEFWRSVVRGSCARARARAPDQCPRSAIMQEFCSRLSWEHDFGCRGARLSITC